MLNKSGLRRKSTRAVSGRLHLLVPGHFDDTIDKHCRLLFFQLRVTLAVLVCFLGQRIFQLLIVNPCLLVGDEIIPE